VVIVRILDEGQYEIDDAHVEKLEELDRALLAAIEGGDEDSFRTALEAVVGTIHENGTKVDDPGHIQPSDLVVPAPDSTLDEVRSLLASEEAGEAGEE
jgi:hypothetical protein